MNRYVLAVFSAVVTAFFLLATCVVNATVPVSSLSARTVAHVIEKAPAAPVVVASSVSAVRMYIVRQGDYLSLISARMCGNPRDWTGIFQASRAVIGSNPDMILPGQRLTISCAGQSVAVLVSRSAPAHHSGKVWGVTYGYPNYYGDGDGDGYDVASPAHSVSQRHSRSFAPAVVQSARVNPGNYSGFQACVISRESGGNSQVMNSTGHYGLYQFSYSTWVAYGGSASAFGHASVSQQNQVFSNAMASPGGASNWSPYDGC